MGKLKERDTTATYLYQSCPRAVTAWSQSAAVVGTRQRGVRVGTQPTDMCLPMQSTTNAGHSQAATVVIPPTNPLLAFTGTSAVPSPHTAQGYRPQMEHNQWVGLQPGSRIRTEPGHTPAAAPQTHQEQTLPDRLKRFLRIDSGPGAVTTPGAEVWQNVTNVAGLSIPNTTVTSQGQSTQTPLQCLQLQMTKEGNRIETQTQCQSTMSPQDADETFTLVERDDPDIVSVTPLQQYESADIQLLLPETKGKERFQENLRSQNTPFHPHMPLLIVTKPLFR